MSITPASVVDDRGRVAVTAAHSRQRNRPGDEPSLPGSGLASSPSSPGS